MSEAGSNFISDKFKIVCRNLNIELAVSLSYHHQSNGQVEVHIKFIKPTIKKCIDTKSNIHIALLQLKSTLLGPGLLSPAMLLFNHPKTGILPIVKWTPINLYNNDEQYEMLVNRQTKNDKNLDTFRNFYSYQ